jgi:hypothetical protein
MTHTSEGAKIVITGPGEYCRADGAKVRITHGNVHGFWFTPNDEWGWNGRGAKATRSKVPAIISTWSARPPGFRKPKPAYRKDGTSRWPVGTKAVLVAWEDGDKRALGETIIVTPDGPMWDNCPCSVKEHPKGIRPLFRKLPEPAPEPQTLEPTEAHGGELTPEDKTFFGLDGVQTLVLYGSPGKPWQTWLDTCETHRLTLHIDTAGNVTGKMEGV